MLQRIIIHEWNQFEKVDIKFDENVTIITGVNGSGKSSLIRLLSKLIGWDYTEIVNKFNKKTRSEQNLPRDIQEFIKKEIQSFNNKHSFEVDEEEIVKGEIVTESNNYTLSIPSNYSNNQEEEILYQMSLTPNEDKGFSDSDYYGSGVNYERGINIPSHRMPYFYNHTEYINSKKLQRNEFYNNYQFELMRRQVTGYDYDSDNQPQQFIKSSLITIAMYSGNNDYVSDSTSNSDDLNEFIEILKKVLPKTLKFKTIKIVDGEVVLETLTGNFLLDAVSGGIGAIIDLVWQIFMAKPEDNTGFFVLIDEIENHLHPSMQRSILPNLVEAFPNIQFIVTTHSPFVVNSIEKAKVIALKYNNNEKVISNELDLTRQYATAMEVLRDILDVPVLLPIWIEERIQRILEKYRGNLNSESYYSLKVDLEKEGLANLMPYSIEKLSKDGRSD